MAAKKLRRKKRIVEKGPDKCSINGDIDSYGNISATERCRPVYVEVYTVLANGREFEVTTAPKVLPSVGSSGSRAFSPLWELTLRIGLRRKTGLGRNCL